MKTKSFNTQTIKVMFIVVAVSFGFAFTNPLKAQSATTNKEKMAPLANWAGEWKGEGWSMDETRQRTAFTVTENIQLKLDGRIISAEGIGKNKGSGSEGFHAFGVFYYNNAQNTFEVKSWLDDGNMTLAKAKINDKGQFIWGFDVPGGSIRYTITLTDTTWNEKGEFVMASGQAFPVMEMNLTKVK